MGASEIAVPHHRRRPVRLAATAALALLATLALTASGAVAKKPTRLYDGTRAAAQPATFSGWQLKDSNGVTRWPIVLGLEGKPTGSQGAIKWKYWRKEKALGNGTAWSMGCASPCIGAYPWDGSKVRITAFRRRAGKFTRVKIFHWTEWGSPNLNDENYNLKLKYLGQDRPGGSWKVVKLNDGLVRPASTTP